MTFKSRPEEVSKQATWIYGMGGVSKRNKLLGSTFLLCGKNSKESGVAGLEGERGKIVGVEFGVRAYRTL